MGFIQYLIHTYGLLAVGAVVGLECVGFPLPGEAALLAAAVYAGTKHDLNIGAVILTAGATAIVAGSAIFGSKDYRAPSSDERSAM